MGMTSLVLVLVGECSVPCRLFEYPRAVLSPLSVISELVFSCPGPNALPAPPSQLVAALTPLFRLEYCFAVRKRLRCVTTAAPTTHCAPPPSLEIDSFCSSLQDRNLLLSSAHPRFDFAITSRDRLCHSTHDTATNAPVASRTVTRSLVADTYRRCRQVWMTLPLHSSRIEFQTVNK